MFANLVPGCVVNDPVEVLDVTVLPPAEVALAFPTIPPLLGPPPIVTGKQDLQTY